jgi:hypothetical protein
VPRFLTAVTALGRITGRRLEQNRIVRAGWTAAQVTLRSFLRVVHLLWLQITGLFFILFAVAGAVAFRGEYHQYQLGRAGPGKAVMALCFALVFAWFGVSSFWRAQRR